MLIQSWSLCWVLLPLPVGFQFVFLFILLLLFIYLFILYYLGYGQNSGAYIFRPNKTDPFPITEKPTVTIVKGLTRGIWELQYSLPPLISKLLVPFFIESWGFFTWNKFCGKNYKVRGIHEGSPNLGRQFFSAPPSVFY